jgi:hypothetical protein
VLPGLYLVRYLLMVIGAYELLSLLWNAIRDRHTNAEQSPRSATALAVVPALSVLLVLGFVFQELPFGGQQVRDDGSTVYAWGPIEATSTNKDAEGDGWSRYNFNGYEGRGASFTEYRNVVTTMEQLGDDPAHGCGRALWENSSENGQYGTTMALMLLPYWTDGCIGSMEGLFFEASGTTPYHFLTTAAMSKQSSNPVRELRYVDNDASVGVRHLQDLGVRYAMVRTDEAKAQAATQADLTLIAQSPPWDIYEVAGSDVVVALDVQPVVVRDRLGDGTGSHDTRERLLETGASWFQQPDEWVAMPADGGPDSWQRVDVQPDLSRRLVAGNGGPRVDIVLPAEPIERVDLAPVSVSNLSIEQQSLEFDVDQVGVPVLVKVSYFPNWQANGDTHVELTYGRRTIDYLAILLTLIGIGLCIWWRREGDLDHAGLPGSAPASTDELAGQGRSPVPPDQLFDQHLTVTGDDPGDGRVGDDVVPRSGPGAIWFDHESNPGGDDAESR